ncbi:DUF3037 domain-containing protein [Actinomycetospora sp. CA-084318]|uniref:DUF3037 domain-containing protein n=1 Tax=Actinomycetospora sp. CA-084318 TaxID=3239892 RepID=UPI003D9757FC
MKFDYSVVRFVPDPFRGEFVNVALIVGNPTTGEWATRRVANASRAQAFRNGAELGAVWDYLDRVDAMAAAVEDDGVVSGDLGPAWLTEEHRRLQNLVQLSRPRPVSAENVDEAMDLLWRRLVVDPAEQPRASTQPTRRALRQAYLSAAIDPALIHENCRAQVGRQSVRVDFAIANGHVAQLAHAFTFRGQNPSDTVRRVKAWSWTMRDVRDRDGHLDYGFSMGLPPSLNGGVPIDVLHDDPVSDEGRRALDEAAEVLEHLDVTLRGAAEVDAVARTAARRLGRGEP